MLRPARRDVAVSSRVICYRRVAQQQSECRDRAVTHRDAYGEWSGAPKVVGRDWLRFPSARTRTHARTAHSDRDQIQLHDLDLNFRPA